MQIEINNVFFPVMQEMGLPTRYLQIMNGFLTWTNICAVKKW